MHGHSRPRIRLMKPALHEMLYDCSTQGGSMMRFFRITLVAVFALSLCFAPKLCSQAVYGSIVGTVLDSSGAAVVGARVTIRNLEREVANETTTNESGNYSQRYLIVGRYQVRVEAPGFQTFVQD